MDDTSLEDFLDGDSEQSSADTEQPPGDTASDASDTETAITTYQWVPSGKTCVSCGEQVTRLWHSETGQVCPDCKEW